MRTVHQRYRQNAGQLACVKASLAFMKVLSLQCGKQHSFEGWFGSEDDFQSQFVRGLVECPMCADRAIVKMPSAPRLNFGGHRESDVSPRLGKTDSSGPTEPAPGTQMQALPDPDQAVTAVVPVGPSPTEQAAFLKAVRHVLANTEDVGDRFPDQARAMHYGDIEPRSIRGQATPREAVELIEEGIDVMALPVPAALKETLQ